MRNRRANSTQSTSFFRNGIKTLLLHGFYLCECYLIQPANTRVRTHSTQLSSPDVMLQRVSSLYYSESGRLHTFIAYTTEEQSWSFLWGFETLWHVAPSHLTWYAKVKEKNSIKLHGIRNKLFILRGRCFFKKKIKIWLYLHFSLVFTNTLFFKSLSFNLYYWWWR